jgi:hypothetical protein
MVLAGGIVAFTSGKFCSLLYQISIGADVMTRINKAALLPLIMILIVPAAVSAAGTINIDHAFNRIEITKHIEYFEDADSSLRIDDVKGKKTGWNTVAASSVNLGYSSSSYWFRFSINNTGKTEQKLFLVLDYPLTDLIELYIPADSQSKRRGTTFRSKSAMSMTGILFLLFPRSRGKKHISS